MSRAHRKSAIRAAALAGLASTVLCCRAEAAAALTQLSSDPYTNATSFHATEVEPDTFAYGPSLVATFQAGRFSEGGSSNIGWATSTDAGATYTHGFLPRTTLYASPAGPYERLSDPAVSFDAKAGIWLISSLAVSEEAGKVRGVAVLVSRSSEDGLSWGAPVVVATASATEDFDKSWITCDRWPASPYFGRCYVEWDDHAHSNRLELARSDDAGLLWSRSGVPAHSAVLGGQPLAQPNGTVVMPIDNGSATALESFVSTNGGETYRGPFPVATISRHREAGGLRASPLPSATISATGEVFVAWQDCRFSLSCGANDIVYSRSTDGRQWSEVARVPLDPAASGVDHFLPGLAVDPLTAGASASLALTYYFYPEAACKTSTCQLDVGFARSSDGGASWSSPLQLAGPIRLHELPHTTQGYMVGDYLSSSFVAGATGDTPLSAFAVGMRVPGTRCKLTSVGSCDEPIEAPDGTPAASIAPATIAPAPGSAEATAHTPPPRSSGEALTAR